MPGTKARRIENEFSDFSLVGTLGAGTTSSRRCWSSTTADASAPTLATEGYESFGARRATIAGKCTGGTSADFTCYVFDGNSQTWYVLTAYGTSGTQQVLAGNTEIRQVSLPCGVTRMHVQLTAKGGSPTAIEAWATLGHGE